MRPLILIVEDEVDAADVLSLVLENWGYETVVCHDGLQGYQLAVSMLPDIVLSDYNMPHMTGLQLAHKLSQQTQTASIPFVLMSALYELLVSTVELELAAVIKKPCDLTLLKEVLAKIHVTPRVRELPIIVHREKSNPIKS